MSHLAYRDEPVALEVDYVVVGSGAGGATAAVTLARGGRTVALVEAGPWRDPSDYPSSAYGAMRDMMDAWSTNLTRGRAFWPVVQGALMGGTTVINSAIVVRTPGDIFAEWQREHGFGADLGPAVWAAQDQIEREINAVPVPEASLGRSSELARDAAKAMGFAGHVMTRNVRDCLGSGQCLQGCRSERKQSLNLNYVPEVIRRGGTVLSCAPVQRVILEGGRAVGVEGRFRHPETKAKGGTFRVRASKGVIVAASATRTPVLLMASGYRHAALGHYFRAHPGCGVFGVYDQPIKLDQGATQGWASVAFRESERIKLETLGLPLEMVSSRLAGGGPELMGRIKDYDKLAHWVMAVRAEATGRVTRGLLGQPVIHYSLGRDDMLRFRNGLKRIALMHLSVGARALITGIYGAPYTLTRDNVDLIDQFSLDPRHWIAILSHLFGGAVMGADPSRSVLTPSGQVRGVESLYVMDAAALPSTLGVNPQHTIMAMARINAERLLGG